MKLLHGSQNENLVILDRPLYLVDDKRTTELFAQGYNFDYDLTEKDNPTVYTIEAEFKNPKYISTEDEYNEFMDIINWIDDDTEVREKLKGYDSIIDNSDKDSTFYMVINPVNSCKILNKEVLEKSKEHSLALKYNI